MRDPSGSLPMPPLELAARTGHAEGVDYLAAWDAIGAQIRSLILELLPPGWSLTDRRVLDFGCGCGRVLRQFSEEAADAELWGCDIHRESVEWLNQNMCPPFRAFCVGERPQIPIAAGFYDLVWAFSVFTHIVEDWGAWLLELHRVLKPDGLAIVSYLGQGMFGRLVGEPWVEERTGMNALRAGQSWDIGGPIVFHSEWWLREHWGRAFEVVRVRSDYSRLADGHGLILLRKRPRSISAADLEAPNPDDPRELAALRHNIAQLHREDRRTRAAVADLSRRLQSSTGAGSETIAPRRLRRAARIARRERK